MAIFNSYVKLPEGSLLLNPWHNIQTPCWFMDWFTSRSHAKMPSSLPNSAQSSASWSFRAKGPRDRSASWEHREPMGTLASCSSQHPGHFLAQNSVNSAIHSPPRSCFFGFSASPSLSDSSKAEVPKALFLSFRSCSLKTGRQKFMHIQE